MNKRFNRKSLSDYIARSSKSPILDSRSQLRPLGKEATELPTEPVRDSSLQSTQYTEKYLEDLRESLMDTGYNVDSSPLTHDTIIDLTNDYADHGVTSERKASMGTELKGLGKTVKRLLGL